METRSSLSDAQLSSITAEISRVFRDRMCAPADVTEMLCECTIPGQNHLARLANLNVVLDRMVKEGKIRNIQPAGKPTQETAQFFATFVPC